MDNYYILNMETQKLELHFDKAVYMALPEDMKREIKSNFLWGRNSGCWISRCKWPHTFYAEQTAKKAGLQDGGKTGERLTFAEQMEVKAEKAEHRAERYDGYSQNAERRAEELQKPINDMHGDIAFFTQPNINTSSGRAFTNKRNRMFAAWDQGFEEFKKSEYYAERAEVARQTAKNATAPTSTGFCQRRIDDAEKAIRAQKRNLKDYEKMLERLNNGEAVKHYNGDPITLDELNNWIFTAETLIEQNIEKSIYYHEQIERLGGIFTKDNINIGDVVRIERWGRCTVESKGTKNIRTKEYSWPISYAEIKEVLEHADPNAPKEEKPIEHPFKAGEILTVKVWDRTAREYVPQPLEITKVSADRVSYKLNGGKAKSVKVYKTWRGDEWRINVDGAMHDCIYKSSEQTTRPA